MVIWYIGAIFIHADTWCHRWFRIWCCHICRNTEFGVRSQWQRIDSWTSWFRVPNHGYTSSRWFLFLCVHNTADNHRDQDRSNNSPVFHERKHDDVRAGTFIIGHWWFRRRSYLLHRDQCRCDRLHDFRNNSLGDRGRNVFVVRKPCDVHQLQCNCGWFACDNEHHSLQSRSGAVLHLRCSHHSYCGW